MIRAVGYFFCLLLIVRCGGEGPPTPFQGDPKESSFPRSSAQPSAGDQQGPYCKKESSGAFESPKTTIATKGKDPKGFFFAEGGGCIARPLRQVWAALHNPLSVKWKDANLVDFTESKQADVDFLFLANYEAGPFFAVQSWTIEWYQTLKEGTVEDPKRLLISYAKVKGTRHITHWKGEFELVALDDKTTSFAMRNELRGTRINEEKAAGGILDIYQNLKSIDPNWTYLQSPETEP